MIKEKNHITLILCLLFFFTSTNSFSVYNASQIQTFIVHVQTPRATKFLHDIERENWHKSFLPNTTLYSGEPRLVYSYDNVISGFAARLTPDEVQSMESVDGFLDARPDDRLSMATTYTPAFIGLGQWEEEGLWRDSFYGQGIIVGVIDSGIDPKHPSFKPSKSMPPPPAKWKGKCGFPKTSLCNNKLIGAMAFHGGCRPPPVDRKKDGHGTHIAGIAAGGFVPDAHVFGQAKGQASGIAPNAHVAVYKVCFRDGCAASDVLAGIDQAISDGADVLSISVVNRRIVPLYNDSIAIGALAAMKKGILPCLPAGNLGPFRSLIFNDAPWILTVGASTIDRRVRVIVKLGNGMELEGESTYQPNNNFTSTTFPLVFPSWKKKSSPRSVDVKGKIVLCKAEGIQNTKLGKLVKRAGGVALIVMNPFCLGSTTLSEPHLLPSAHLRYSSALKVISYLESNTDPVAAIEFDGTRFGARPSPAVAAFSSRGPSLTNGGILKPDIVAPGANILSSAPSSSAFEFRSGTSTATPHVAGVVALLKRTHPQWSPAAIKSALMTTASRRDVEGNPISDEYMGEASIFTLGSGQVNPSAANDPGLVYDIQPDQYMDYLCSSGFTSKQVTIIAHQKVTCPEVSDIVVGELNYPSISVYLKPGRKTVISRTATNVGEADEVYALKLEEPEGVRMDVFPYKLHFYKIGQKIRFLVEFHIKGVDRKKGEVAEGQLSWISGKHVVRSPISVIFL